MNIRMVDIPPEGLSLAGQEPQESLDLGDPADLRPAGPLAYRVKIMLAPGTLFMKGSLELDMEFRCTRCDCWFAQTVRDPQFTRDWELDEDNLLSPSEEGSEDLESLLQEAAEDPESVDLTLHMREAIILAFPSYPVCQTDCKGLCPQCGKELNSGGCDCSPPADDRWDALDQLSAN